jgi:arylamine N-acetyltransferase
MTGLFQRYLRLLGIAGHPSGLDGLRTLVRRHLSAVPFENISKLLLLDRERAGRVTTLPEFLDGIEYSDLGGTCLSDRSLLL